MCFPDTKADTHCHICFVETIVEGPHDECPVAIPPLSHGEVRKVRRLRPSKLAQIAGSGLVTISLTLSPMPANPVFAMARPAEARQQALLETLGVESDTVETVFGTGTNAGDSNTNGARASGEPSDSDMADSSDDTSSLAGEAVDTARGGASETDDDNSMAHNGFSDGDDSAPRLRIRIVMHANGATSGEDTSVIITDGSKWSLPKVSLRRRGHVFAGWSTARDHDAAIKTYGIPSPVSSKSAASTTQTDAPLWLVDGQEGERGFVYEAEEASADGTTRVVTHSLRQKVSLSKSSDDTDDEASEQSDESGTAHQDAEDAVLDLYAQWTADVDTEASDEEEDASQATVTQPSEPKDEEDAARDASDVVDSHAGDYPEEEDSITSDELVSSLREALGQDETIDEERLTNPLLLRLNVVRAPAAEPDLVAVLTGNDLVFCQTYGSYYGDSQHVVDINGREYTGYAYPNLDEEAASWSPWVSGSSRWQSIRRVYAAPGSVIRPYSMEYMFSWCSNIESIDLTGFVSAGVSMRHCFAGLSNLKSLDLSMLDTSSVTDMSFCFSNDSALESVSMNGWDTSSVTDMSFMFQDCSQLPSLDVSMFDTSSVTNMASMFVACSGLTSIDVSSFDTQKVSNMSSVFQRCTGLLSIDLSSWSTPSVTNLSYMLAGMTSCLSMDLSSLDARNATNMRYMFGSGEGGLDSYPLALKAISLGSNFRFGDYCVLATQSGPSNIKWSHVESGGTLEKTLSELRSGWAANCSAWAGTWESGSSWAGVIDADGNMLMFKTYEGDTLPRSDGVTDTHGTWHAGSAFSTAGSMTSSSGGYLAPSPEAVVTFAVVDGYSCAPKAMTSWFYGMSNLVSANLAGMDLSSCSSMASLFNGCSSLRNVDFAEVDTSHVTNMFNMFNGCSSMTTLDLSQLDTSHVTQMSYIMRGMTSLDTLILGARFIVPSSSPLELVGTWENVSIGSGSVSSAALANLFRTATSAAANAGTWTRYAESFVMFTDDNEMVFFRAASPSNSYTLGHLTMTDVDGTERTGYAYYLSVGWSVSASNGATRATRAYVAPGQTIRVASSTTKMDSWFSGMTSLRSCDLRGLDTSGVTSMYMLFFGDSSLTDVDVSSFDTSSVTDMRNVFNGCSSLTELDVSSFDTSAATNMTNFFPRATTTDNIWAIRRLTLGEGFRFAGNGSMASTTRSVVASQIKGEPDGMLWQHLGGDLPAMDAGQLMAGYDANASLWAGTWVISCAYASLMPDGTLVMFRSSGSYVSGASATAVDIMGNEYVGTVFSGFETALSLVPDRVPWRSRRAEIKRVYVAEGSSISPVGLASPYWFDGCRSLVSVNLARLDTSKVTNLSYMFSGCSSLTELVGLDSWDTSAVEDMTRLFSSCKSLQDLFGASSFDTSHVISMSGMFDGCSSLESLDVSGFDTGRLQAADRMFYGCEGVDTLDVSEWDTSSLRNASYMFWGCSSLSGLDTSGWDTSSMTNMSLMFAGCVAEGFDPDVSGWDTSNVTNMMGTFLTCPHVQPDVSGWETGSVTDMRGLFSGCSAIEELDLSGWDMGKVTAATDMLASCDSLRSVSLGTGFNSGTGKAYLPSLSSLPSPYTKKWVNSSVPGSVGVTAAQHYEGYDGTSGSGSLGPGTYVWETLKALSFDLAGGVLPVGVTYPTSFAPGEGLPLPGGEGASLPAPTKDGYDFGGWSDSEGTVMWSVPQTAADDLALTAVWNVVNLTITVPTVICYDIMADGTLIGSTNAYIENETQGHDVRISHVDAEAVDSGWHIVKDVTREDGTRADGRNLISVEMGPVGDQLSLSDMLTGVNVSGESWEMDAAGEARSSIALVATGRASDVSIGEGERPQIATIRWSAELAG